MGRCDQYRVIACTTKFPFCFHPDRADPIAQRFVLHWGEMGSRWGVNRTVAQIHALIYLQGRPLHAEEIAATLQVARSNVSTSLRDLAHGTSCASSTCSGTAAIISRRRTTHGTSCARSCTNARRASSIRPSWSCANAWPTPDFAAEALATRTRLQQTLALMEALSSWCEDMLRLDTATLTRLMRMGDKVRALLPGSKAARKG
jgi:DNA-binding transcriptional regulator GbsR (MarR family)